MARRPLSTEEIQQKLELEAVLANPKGRRYLLRVMERCGVWRSCWDSSARIHFNAGKQDAGREIREEIETLFPEYWIEIERLRLAGRATTITTDEDDNDD